MDGYFRTPMKPATAIALLLTGLVLLLALHLHDEAHRYDVVVAGAGSGGSQTDSGSTEIVGYLVDHKTGKVWFVEGADRIPTVLHPCRTQNTNETERGCEFKMNPNK
jgi:hypothetical protein